MFLAINKDGKILAGTIDKELVTDDMTSDTVIECLTTPDNIAIDVEGGGSYVTLSKDDSFVKVTDDDPAFPKLSDLISKINVNFQALRLN